MGLRSLNCKIRRKKGGVYVDVARMLPTTYCGGPSQHSPSNRFPCRLGAVTIECISVPRFYKIMLFVCLQMPPVVAGL